MSSVSKVYVAGIGMITAIGETAGMTAAAVRAGISGYQHVDEYDRSADPFKMALVPEAILPPLNKELERIGLAARQRRLLRLSVLAMQEALQMYPANKPLPLFLAGPETLPECAPALRSDFVHLLNTQAGISIDSTMSRIFATGRAGGFQAIDMAFRYFEATGNDYALVGGIDTCLDLYLLATLDKEARILTEERQDGFVPGEAAGFLLLMSEGAREKMGDLPFTAVYPPGLANETGHRYSQEPYRGDGLSKAFRHAIANADIKTSGVSIASLYSSMNGEGLAAKEYGVAVTRNQTKFAENVQHNHPADCFGDIGAAFVPVLAGIIASHKRPSNQATLVYCSSDKQLRGAMVVV